MSSGDSQTVEIYRYYATLHSELTPYLFSYSVEANQTGLSIIRDSDEAMSHHRLGEELFVSVITEDGDNVTKTVTFPSGGNWIDYWKQDTLYPGGSSLNYQANLETYPIFIKAGAIIPTNASICSFCQSDHGGIFGRPLSSALNGWPATNRTTLNIFPSGHSSFTFHRPEGDGIAFEDMIVTVDESAGTIHVNGQSSESYRLRVKSFSGPTSVLVGGVTSTWNYDPTHQYVIIDVSGSDFTITINGLAGYSGVGIPPPPPPPPSGQTTSLTAAHSQKCLEIPGSSQNTGAGAVQRSCTGAANQQFQLTIVGTDIFQLMAAHSGQCLEIAGASTANAARVQQNACTTSTHQQFRLTSSPSTLVAVHSGKCIDVSSVSTNDGQPIHQWTCHGGLNQQWAWATGG